MSNLTGLAEYLLAYTLPGGGKVCRYGFEVETIPIFPPDTSVTFTITPYFGAYAAIEFYCKVSPAVVPGTIELVSSHSGMEISAGVLGELCLTEGLNFWIEITDQNPVYTILTNVSTVSQFYEVIDMFLLIDNEANYEKVKELIRLYGGSRDLVEAQRTNHLLESLVRATPGAKMPSLIP